MKTNKPEKKIRPLQAHMDEVMDYFDFHKVHITMKHLKWFWHDSKEVPSIADLRKHVRCQMGRIYGKNNYGVSSGGFKTKYFSGTEDGVKWDYFEVAFIVSDWDTNDA